MQLFSPFIERVKFMLVTLAEVFNFILKRTTYVVQYSVLFTLNILLFFNIYYFVIYKTVYKLSSNYLCWYLNDFQIIYTIVL